MSAGVAIFGKLSTTAGVTALIGAGAACRVYPSQALQLAAFPLVAYEVNSSDYDQTYAGPSGLSSHAVTISSVGLTHDSAEALAAAALTAINGVAGTWGAVTVLGCFVNDVGDALETTIESDKRVWRKDIQVTIWIAA